MKDWLMRLVAVPLAPLLRLIFKYDFQGLDNIPDSGPFIIASNHISYIDPIVLIHVGMRFRKPRPNFYLRFLSKAELFRKQPLRFILRSASQIPVDRGTSSASDSLKSARASLVEGEAICIFPEGTISLTLLPMKPHTGVGRLALDSGVPVIPTALWGTHRTWGKHHKRQFGYHRPVNIAFGEPLVLSEGSAHEASERIMDEVFDLVDAARRDYPDEPGPDDWWGPPEWPVAAGAHWRPKIDKTMPTEEQLERAHDAMMSEAERIDHDTEDGVA